ncbi:MAG: M3 family oligoendopeptidase [Anaerolineales bacterium]|nr:M3 family oligoendopeptidase [Anaerolineales bacterium]
MTETYKQDRWQLDDLFSGFETEKVTETLNEIEKRLSVFESIKSTLSADMDAEDFVKVLDQYDSLIRLLSRLVGYSHLRFAEDTQDQEAQMYLAGFQQKIAESDNRSLFFKLWWKDLDEQNANRLMDASGDYRYFLEYLRVQKPYTLSEAEEKVINLKDVNGAHALTRLYDSITNRYVYKMVVDGEEQELTRGELAVYARSSDPDLRAASYKELFRVYENDLPILGQIYMALVSDWHSENVDLRGFSCPISVRNLGNDVPDEVVNTLLEVSEKNAVIFQDYFRLKAQWLGVDKLRRYDVYAPVVQSDKRYSYQEAIDLVKTSYSRFDSEYAELAEKIFASRHIDSEVRKGKRSGAFCATIEPDLLPWVLTSYQGRADDVATLAHELGHAVHSMLAADHTALTQDPSLPLAETASTFGEMLVVDYLLSQDSDPEVRRDLLFRQMDDNYATIMRQAYFAIFERDAHALIKKGASIIDLNEAYQKNLQTQFGDSLELNEEFKLEWAVIPHIFHTPFYVYAYAFGQLLVLSLYQQYRREGETFKPIYRKILAAGGSASPAQILTDAGIDMASPAFWQGGFDVMKESLEELKQIPVSR